MEKEKIVVSNPVTVSGSSITVISREKLIADGKRRFFAFVSKEPLVVIAASADRKRYFRITGEELTEEQFNREYEGVLPESPGD